MKILNQNWQVWELTSVQLLKMAYKKYFDFAMIGFMKITGLKSADDI